MHDMHENGDTVADKKIQLVIRNDATTPDVGRRRAQDLIVDEKVHIRSVGVTPVADSSMVALRSRAAIGPWRRTPSPLARSA